MWFVIYTIISKAGQVYVNLFCQRMIDICLCAGYWHFYTI